MAAPPAPLDPSRVLNINVGIVGHVDSGKTSIVRALSTVLSTAALDKNPQSKERGITLDLGFSALVLPLPDEVASEAYDAIQFTLVDCPGHASLIKTIIGGAQIIDLLVLVVDVVKGVQAQTIECAAIGETAVSSSDQVLVALNKVDLLPAHEREAGVARAEKQVKTALRSTKFGIADYVGVSAAMANSANTDTRTAQSDGGIQGLVERLISKAKVPEKAVESKAGTFCLAVDHCFAIKGKGTILTGTVFSGCVSIDDVIELPALGLTRKVKGLQIFRRPVKKVQQGERVALCVPNLDASQLERGIAAACGSIAPMTDAIALVRKVSFFGGCCPSGSKLHVTIGYTTVIATVTFFGAAEMALAHPQEEREQGESPCAARWWAREYALQNDLVGAGTNDEGEQNPPQYALLRFSSPVFCPPESAVIGSRLDTVSADEAQANLCRLAFSGRILEAVSEADLQKKLSIYIEKQREGVVDRVGDKRVVAGVELCFDLIGRDLFRKETNMAMFQGMIIMTENGDVGIIDRTFGKGDKFRRLLFNKGKRMMQEHLAPALAEAKLRGASLATHAWSPNKLSATPGTGGGLPELSKAGKVRVGVIDSFKGEPVDGRWMIAIVSGLFSMEEDPKEHIGEEVQCEGGDVGELTAAFGKAGKCRVAFKSGTRGPVGAKVVLGSAGEHSVAS